MTQSQLTQSSDNRTVVITGVSRGLNATVVTSLVAADLNVVGCARSPDVVGDLGTKNGHSLSVPG